MGLASLALFLPLIRSDLGLTFAQAGALSAVMNIAYAAVQVPAGYLADRSGPKRLFVVGLLGASGLTFSLAYVGPFPVLLANQLAAGLFRSIMFAPGVLLISAWFPAKRRATAIATYVSGGFAANLLLSVAGPVVEPAVGWRGVLAGVAVLGTGLAVLFAMLGSDRQRELGGVAATMNVGRLLRSKILWLISGIQFARLAAAQGFTFWLPTFLIVEKHQSLQTAGILLAVMALMTIPSTFAGGYVADRLRRPLSIVGLSLFMLAATIFLIGRVEGLVWLIALIVVAGIFVQLYFGPLFALPIEIFGSSHAGVVSGFGNLAANLGAVAAVYMIGFLRDRSGSFASGFDLVAIVCFLGMLLTVLVAFLTSPRQDQKSNTSGGEGRAPSASRAVGIEREEMPN